MRATHWNKPHIYFQEGWWQVKLKGRIIAASKYFDELKCMWNNALVLGLK